MRFFRTVLFVNLLWLIMSCASQPTTFVETHDEVGVWKAINLHNNYGIFQNKNQEIWRRVVDVLSEKYDLEVLDRPSGYLRTSWKYLLLDDSQEKYRSRVIIKMQGTLWHTAKLKTEAQWWDNSRQVWITGYDTAILEEIYQDIQGRIGTSVR